MHLKHKGHRVGVLFVDTLTIITFLSAGWCEATLEPHSLSTPHHNNEQTGGLSHPSGRQVTGRLRLDSGHGDGQESANRPSSKDVQNVDGATTGTSGGRPGRGLGGGTRSSPSSSSDAGLTRRDDPRQAVWGWLHSAHNPPIGNCSKGKIQHVVQDNFYVTGQLDPHAPVGGYQADSAAPDQVRVGSSAESWQKLQPVVECGDHAMTLTVRRRRSVQLLLDRANESSVPLSLLPPRCGYSVQTTWRDLVLMARYDACHVTQEDEGYALPLLWRGTPVKMFCPVSRISPEAAGPSSLCCSPYGMTVRVRGLSAAEEHKINVRGQWTLLELLAEQCGYTLDKQDGETVIAAPFISCGISVKNGKYTLSLQIGKNIFKLACPVSPPDQLSVTDQPAVDSPPHLTRRATKPPIGSLKPFPWAPPFYLAPPYHPHPTYIHNYDRSKGHDSYNRPTPLSLTPEPTLASQQDYRTHQTPLRQPYEHFTIRSSLSSRGEMEDSSQVYPDQKQEIKRQNQETPVLDLSQKFSGAPTGYPAQVEAPHFQPPRHDFNPYYHYYHHPKIPLPGTPQNHDPGPEASEDLSPTDYPNHDFPLLPPNIQQSKGLNSPVAESTSHPYILPTTDPNFADKAPVHHAPRPPQPLPFHYFYYLPHIARGEAKISLLLHPDVTTKTNLSNSNSLSHSPALPVHDERGVNPHIDETNADKAINMETSRPERIKHPFLSDDNMKSELDDFKRGSASETPALQPQSSQSDGGDPVEVPPPDQPSLPTPAFIYNPNYYQYYYHPYYDYYYQMYYGYDGWLGADNHVSPTPSETPEPLLQASSSPSYHEHQTSNSPTESVYDTQHAVLHPYYYYYPVYHLQAPTDNKELHPTDSKESEKASSESEFELPSGFDHIRMEWFPHAAEAGYLQDNPFYCLYSQYITQQHLYNPFWQPGGEEAKEKLDNEIRDHLKANTHTLSALPCGLGPVSDVDCSNSLGCCSKVCTVGQYLVVPDSLIEPTVAPPAHSSEDRNATCALQRLTSDLDIYMVPLEGCGVNKHMFGQTVVHLLEVQSFHSHHDRSSAHEDAPVRLMVGCSSSPDSPGEVSFHVLARPPLPHIQPTPAAITVQLRIATDASFTSFHPEAHLPLSLMQGRVVYVEVSLPDPPEPNLVLLVHSCLAYTQAPYASWMLVYDGCSSQGVSQLLSSPHSQHIWKIKMSSFLSLPMENSHYRAGGGYSFLEDPEIYFSCLTEVCSAAGGDCTVSCLKGPNTDV